MALLLPTALPHFAPARPEGAADPPVVDHEALPAAVDLDPLLAQHQSATGHILDRAHTAISEPCNHRDLLVTHALCPKPRDGRAGQAGEQIQKVTHLADPPTSPF